MLRQGFVLAFCAGVFASDDQCDSSAGDVCLVQTVATTSSTNLDIDLSLDGMLVEDIDPATLEHLDIADDQGDEELEEVDTVTHPVHLPDNCNFGDLDIEEIVSDVSNQNKEDLSAVLRRACLADSASTSDDEPIDDNMVPTEFQVLLSKYVPRKMSPFPMELARCLATYDDRFYALYNIPVENVTYGHDEPFTILAFEHCLLENYRWPSFGLKYPRLRMLLSGHTDESFKIRSGNPTWIRTLLSAYQDLLPELVENIIKDPLGDFLELYETLLTNHQHMMSNVVSNTRAFVKMYGSFIRDHELDADAVTELNSNTDFEQAKGIQEDMLREHPLAFKAAMDNIADTAAEEAGLLDGDGGYENFVQNLQQRLVMKGHATEDNVSKLVQERLQQLNLTDHSSVQASFLQHTMKHLRIHPEVMAQLKGMERFNAKEYA